MAKGFSEHRLALSPSPPWQSVLMILGITLGWRSSSPSTANESASQRSTEYRSGRRPQPTRSGGPDALTRSIIRLRRAGIVTAAAPVISEYGFSPQLGNQPVQLLGIDPFAEAPFRSYLGDRQGPDGSTRPAPLAGDLTAFLTRPGAVLVSQDVAELYGLSLDSPLTLDIAGRQHQVCRPFQPGDA
jgi:putative ABC transport system permease protein